MKLSPKRRMFLLLAMFVPVFACETPPERPAAGPAPAEEAPEERVPEEAPDAWLENDGPLLSAEEVMRVTVPIPSSWASEPAAYALFAGRVHRYSREAAGTEALGLFVEIAHETEFAMGGDTQRSEFYTLYARLGSVDVTPRERVAAGDTLGAAREGETGLRVGVYTRTDDPVWRRQTGRPPIAVDGYYFWDPSFVLSPP